MFSEGGIPDLIDSPQSFSDDDIMPDLIDSPPPSPPPSRSASRPSQIYCITYCKNGKIFMDTYLS